MTPRPVSRSLSAGRTLLQKAFFHLLPLALLTLPPLCGCETLKQFAQAATFAQCQFRLASVEGTTLAGIQIQGKTQASDIDYLALARFQGALSEGAQPLEFTVNVEVKNPNASDAAMNKLAWILYLDDNEMTLGVLRQRVRVPANGGTGTVPLAVSLDLLKVLSGKTLDSILNVTLNVAGEGSLPCHLLRSPQGEWRGDVPASRHLVPTA